MEIKIMELEHSYKALETENKIYKAIPQFKGVTGPTTGKYILYIAGTALCLGSDLSLEDCQVAINAYEEGNAFPFLKHTNLSTKIDRDNIIFDTTTENIFIIMQNDGLMTEKAFDDFDTAAGYVEKITKFRPEESGHLYQIGNMNFIRIFKLPLMRSVKERLYNEIL